MTDNMDVPPASIPFLDTSGNVSTVWHQFFITLPNKVSTAANDEKETNVPTALELAAPTATTVPINSDGSSPDITLIEATASTAGILGSGKFDEIVTNTLKETNVTTNLSEGTPTETTVDINSSDGSNATIVSASTSRAGILTKVKFDEIVASTAAKHAESHNIASHSDTTATGVELDTLTDNSIADALHRHSELVASDGSPDPALSIDADGKVGIGTTSPDSTIQVVGDVRLGEDITNYFETKTDGEVELHGTARVYKTSWVDAGGLRAPGLKPATFVESGLVGSWEFADAVSGSEESIAGVWKIPADVDRTQVCSMKLNWYADGISPGNCEWQLEYLWVALNENETAAAQETLTTTATASTTSNGMCNAEFTGIDLPSASDSGFFFKITRLSAHANDTIADVVLLRGRAIKYVANKLGIVIS